MAPEVNGNCIAIFMYCCCCIIICQIAAQLHCGSVIIVLGITVYIPNCCCSIFIMVVGEVNAIIQYCMHGSMASVAMVGEGYGGRTRTAVAALAKRARRTNTANILVACDAMAIN
jgi:hypothetical protein